MEQKISQFSVDVLDDNQEFIYHVGNNDTESIHSSLSSISNKLKKRDKYIRIADAMEEYQNDSTGSDCGDSRKVNQAEQGALKKK